MKRDAIRTGVRFPLLAVACGSEPTRSYDNNDLELATPYTAKEVCSCIFVMEQTDAYLAWTRASPDVASFKIDREAKTVQAQAFMLWGAKARFVSDRFGCVLE